jgi:porphobilinogen synthase
MAIKYGRPIEARLAPVESKPKSQLNLTSRLRRNRKAEWTRRLVREHVLTRDDLIWPLFLVDGSNVRIPVASMPGIERVSIDQALRDAERGAKLAIPCIALFPYTDPKLRDPDGVKPSTGQSSLSGHTRHQEGTTGDRDLCDVALDPYTSHGHDGLLRDGIILNDETIEVPVSRPSSRLRRAATSSHPRTDGWAGGRHSHRTRSG